jgi:hypothetical protein
VSIIVLLGILIKVVFADWINVQEVFRQTRNYVLAMILVLVLILRGHWYQHAVCRNASIIVTLDICIRVVFALRLLVLSALVLYRQTRNYVLAMLVV